MAVKTQLPIYEHAKPAANTLHLLYQQPANHQSATVTVEALCLNTNVIMVPTGALNADGTAKTNPDGSLETAPVGEIDRVTIWFGMPDDTTPPPAGYREFETELGKSEKVINTCLPMRPGMKIWCKSEKGTVAFNVSGYTTTFV